MSFSPQDASLAPQDVLLGRSVPGGKADALRALAHHGRKVHGLLKTVLNPRNCGDLSRLSIHFLNNPSGFFKPKFENRP